MAALWGTWQASGLRTSGQRAEAEWPFRSSNSTSSINMTNASAGLQPAQVDFLSTEENDIVYDAKNYLEEFIYSSTTPAPWNQTDYEAEQDGTADPAGMPEEEPSTPAAATGAAASGAEGAEEGDAAGAVGAAAVGAAQANATAGAAARAEAGTAVDTAAAAGPPGVATGPGLPEAVPCNPAFSEDCQPNVDRVQEPEGGYHTLASVVQDYIQDANNYLEEFDKYPTPLDQQPTHAEETLLTNSTANSTTNATVSVIGNATKVTERPVARLFMERSAHTQPTLALRHQSGRGAWAPAAAEEDRRPAPPPPPLPAQQAGALGSKWLEELVERNLAQR